MTGQQLIDLIQENELENFEIRVILVEIDHTPNAPWGGYNQRTFKLENEITDIGYSDKTFKISLINPDNDY